RAWQSRGEWALLGGMFEEHTINSMRLRRHPQDERGATAREGACVEDPVYVSRNVNGILDALGYEFFIIFFLDNGQVAREKDEHVLIVANSPLCALVEFCLPFFCRK